MTSRNQGAAHCRCARARGLRALSLLELLLSVAILAASLMPLLGLHSGLIQHLARMREELLIENLMEDIADLASDAPNSALVRPLIRTDGGVLTIDLPSNRGLRALRFAGAGSTIIDPAFDVLITDQLTRLAPKVEARIERAVDGVDHLNRLFLLCTYEAAGGRQRRKTLTRLFYGYVETDATGDPFIGFGLTN